MTQTPLVSIGLPTYNRAAKLPICIEGIFSQTYKNLEIIVSDNCSDDIDVRTILEKYKKLDQRIAVYYQTKNIEAEPNFDFVYQKATGKYFMWMSDDDKFDVDYIKNCVKFLEQHQEYTFCTGKAIYIKENQIVFEEPIKQYTSRYPIIRMFNYLYDVRKNGIFYGLFRNKISLIDPVKKSIGYDWCILAQFLLKGKMRVLENITCFKDLSGGSLNRNALISRWNTKGLNKLFFETYSAFHISINIFNESTLKRKYSYLIRIFMEVIIFIFLNIKFLINSIAIRTWAKKYR